MNSNIEDNNGKEFYSIDYKRKKRPSEEAKELKKKKSSKLSELTYLFQWQYAISKNWFNIYPD